MLMDTDLDEHQMDYAQTAHRSGKDLISVINEVLDQAKIEAGKLELEAVGFDPRAVLDEVLSFFSSKSNEKGIEVKSNFSINRLFLLLLFGYEFLHILVLVCEYSWLFTHPIRCLKLSLVILNAFGK